MKFIATGDIHLYVPKSLPQDWCMNRYRMLWDTLISLCKEHHAGLIIAGDCFHQTKPNLAETQLFIELLIKLKDNGVETYIISGNHENIGNLASCLDHFAELMEEMKVHYYKADSFKDMTFIGHTHLEVGLNDIASSPILITHVRPTVNQFIQEEIDIAKLIKPYQLVIASDIHMPLELFNGKLVYTNAPLNIHFEENPNTGVILLDTKTLEWSRISTTHLPQLVQVNCTPESYEDLVLKEGNFYRVEVKGSAKELRKISTENPDVKLLKVPVVLETYVESEDAAEVRDLTLEESFIEYMQELKMDEETISKMIAVWRQL